MKSIARTTRLPQSLVRRIHYRSRRERIDESTALRQLLDLGLQEYAIKLYKQGEITLREAVQITDLTMREVLEILYEHGVKGNIQYDTQQKSLEIIKEFY